MAATLAIGGALVVAACGGTRGIERERSLTPQQKARIAAIARQYGSPRSVALLNAALVNLRRQNYGNAIQAATLADANQSIAIFPKPAGTYALRGLIQHALGRNAAARRDFQEALDRNPRSQIAEAGLRALNAGRRPYRPKRYRQTRPGSRESSI